jgi:hypothetical protein
MAAFKSFEDIQAWQKARQLCKLIGKAIEWGVLVKIIV